MDTIVLATGSVTVLGFLCAIMLAVASKVMAVEVDERVSEVRALLPGANCGACGYTGCDGYADAIINDEARLNLCIPGGSSVVMSLSSYLGVEAEAVIAQIAVVHCRGDSNALQRKMEYSGIKTCAAAKQLFGGQNACIYGCLGFGDCEAVCPEDAICIEDGLARVDPRKCIGCTLCTAACPNKIISMDSDLATAQVLCKNTERGAATRRKCTAGCIACTLCVRGCPAEAIEMGDNIAIVDQSKCIKCGHCNEVCAPKCMRLAKGAPVMETVEVGS